MTLSVTTITSQQDSTQAGAELGRTIREGLNGGSADAVVVFASAQHDYQRLLSALVETSGTEVVVGSSSAGEFTNSSRGEGYVSALGLRSESMQFAVGIGRNLTANPTAAARQVVETFAGLAGRPMPYRSALVMTDALAGHTDALVEEMTIATGGNYRFFGGGAGDDGRFQKTYVFAGTQAMSDAVVALEMLSMQPVGVGVSHGWTPGGPGLRVTEVDGSRLISLNGAPALQAFEDYAEATRQKLDQEYPLPFFLHNILGIESNGSFRLRVPLGIGADGSVSCAAAIPRGA
ncbi:MAG: FIST signal transduction protein, partial [Burkholderiales bacterium]